METLSKNLILNKSTKNIIVFGLGTLIFSFAIFFYIDSIEESQRTLTIMLPICIPGLGLLVSLFQFINIYRNKFYITDVIVTNKVDTINGYTLKNNGNPIRVGQNTSREKRYEYYLFFLDGTKECYHRVTRSFYNKVKIGDSLYLVKTNSGIIDSYLKEEYRLSQELLPLYKGREQLDNQNISNYVNNYDGYAPESIEKTFHKIRRGVLIFFIIIVVIELFFVVFGA